MGAFKKGVVVGFLAGYVRGSKAGRERYEQIMKAAGKVKASPAYQRAQSKIEAAIGMGIERGKLLVLDSVKTAKSKSHGEFEKEIRSTFH